MIKEHSLSTLAMHPPQKLQDSHYFNYYKSYFEETGYLDQKKQEQQQLLRDTNNFRIVCDRNYLATSQYHRTQKFGVSSNKQKVISQEMLIQREILNKNQNKKQKIQLKKNRTNSFCQENIFKQVIVSPKLSQGITMQFISIQVKLLFVNPNGPNKLLLTQKYNFQELRNILDYQNTDICVKILDHIQQNINEPVKKNITTLKFEKLDQENSDLMNSYFPQDIQKDIQIDDQTYRVKIIFPKITFYVQAHVYEQHLRISRQMIKDSIDEDFQKIDQFINQFNKKKMNNELKKKIKKKSTI